MTSPRANRPATRGDLEKLPDNVVGEILCGELHVSPRPASRHALACTMLGVDLGSTFHGPKRPGGGGWWILDEPELELGEDIVVPDLAGWRRERLPVLPDVAAFTIAPDWICEVMSPSTARVDRMLKLPIYFNAGVKHAWLLDPLAESVDVFRHTPDGWLLVTTVGAAERVRIEPFEIAEIDLARLWDRGEVK
jgi:Uma2 family endonuclease